MEHQIRLGFGYVAKSDTADHQAKTGRHILLDGAFIMIKSPYYPYNKKNPLGHYNFHNKHS